MSTVTIPGVERVYTCTVPVYETQMVDILDPETGEVVGQEEQTVWVRDEEQETREWVSSIPYSQFPAGPRRCVPDPDGPGYVWLVEVPD